MASRRGGKLHLSKPAVILITVVGLIAAILAVRTLSLMREERAYAARESAAAAEYEDEKARGASIQESAAYVKSRDFIEKEAQDKLNLDYPEGKRPEETEDAAAAQAENAGQAQSADGDQADDAGQAQGAAAEQIDNAGQAQSAVASDE